MTACAAACQIGDTIGALRFDRTGLAAHQYWRLLTGHFVHLNGRHFLLNAIGLGLVWALVGRCYRWRAWLLIIVASIAGIDGGLWWFDPDLQWYVGLSGLLHGMLAAGVIANRREHPVEALVLGAMLFAKLLYEQVWGSLPATSAIAAGNVIVDAHLYGAIAGSVMAVVVLRYSSNAN